MTVVLIAVGVVVLSLILFSLRGLMYLARPNEALILYGSKRRASGRNIGYRLVKGRFAIRKPFLEKVARLDLTNMIIELTATNAYSKGGVPLNVQAVANVKIAGHEPVIFNAVERFLGKPREEAMAVARATLEGALRGVLATLTPEQANEDRELFLEQVTQEADQDMEALGLVVDTLQIQNIVDEVKYLDSIGRIRNSELISSARIAEAEARADAAVRSAENFEKETRAQITAAIDVARADAERALTDARTRRDALVAEEQAAVAALLAQAEAEVPVQQARVEQVRRQLEADIIAPAKAEMEALEQQATASVAPIIEDGTARAQALERLAESWHTAGDRARQIFILQKIEPVIDSITSTISSTPIDKVTVIDTGNSNSSSTDPKRLLQLSEQVKEIFGIDVVEKLKQVTDTSDQPRSRGQKKTKELGNSGSDGARQPSKGDRGPDQSTRSDHVDGPPPKH